MRFRKVEKFIYGLPRRALPYGNGGRIKIRLSDGFELLIGNRQQAQMRKDSQFSRQKSHRISVSLGTGAFHQSDGTSAACPVDNDNRLSQNLLCRLG
ncbi:hypothetical protein D3C81_1643750 [compost metagenome]